MNWGTIVSLLATVAYIPLFIILIANRPWHKRHKLFALFLAGAMIWSLGTFLFRSDYLMSEKMLLAKLTIALLCLSVAPLHYFLRTYYEKTRPGFPFVYLVVGLCVILVIIFVPEEIKLDDGIVPVYGFWLLPLMLVYYVLLGRDIYLILQKIRSIKDPNIYNQMIYLVLGLSVSIIIVASAFSKIGQDYPVPQLGNFVMALILTYTVMKQGLLDFRVVARRALTLLSMVLTGIGAYLLIFAIAHMIFGFELISFNLALGIGIALIIAISIYQSRRFVARQIDKLFYRDSFEFREKLLDFAKNRTRRMIDLNEFGNELLHLLAGAIRCQKAYLMLPVQRTNDFYIRFAVPSNIDRASLVIQNDSPIIQWLKRENTYLPREKLDIEPEFKGLWMEENNSISQLDIHLFLPILSRGKLVGLLALGEKKNNRRYSLEDVNLSEKIINDVSTSLEKEYLQDELKKREQELSLVSRLSSVITSSLNIDTVYDVFVKELKEVVDVDYAAIALIEGNEIYFAAISSEVGLPWSPGQKIPIGNTATEWVSLNKKLYYEQDISISKRFWTSGEYIKHNLKSLLYLPLINKGDVIGILILGSKRPNAYGHGQVVLLERLASQIAAPIENSRLFSKTEQIARVDGLSGLFNRRHFDERMNEEINRHARYGDVLSILLLDLDNFKKYNDTFGHLAGDRLLLHAAELIKLAIRSSDLAFRYGGDEFAVILPNSSTMDAFNVAERIREKISFEMTSRQLDVTTSIGVASCPGDGSTLDELCNAADMALYYAKRTGQNRTSIASRTLFSLNETSIGVNAEAEVLSTIYALAATLEARDKFTYGHSRKVSRFAVAVAEALNMAPKQVAMISAAALLHDIGKVGIPDQVLNKEGKLLDEEWELLKQHPLLSAAIVGHVPSLSACMAAVRHHHERWDGKGYPSGLKAEAIPIEARVLTVADSFEAMISERPYRKALTYKQAISELEHCSGSQFDPQVVQAFIPIALSTGTDDKELALQRNRKELD